MPSGQPGKILDKCCKGELAAGLMAFEDKRLEIRACCVDGSGKSGAAGAEDDSVARRVFRHKSFLSVNARRRKKMQDGLLVKELRLWQI